MTVKPILHEIVNFTIPFNVEIPPVPIYSNYATTIKFFGLPNGVYYDFEDHLLSGKPTTLGRHGVVAIASNQEGFDYIGFNIDVINFERIPVDTSKISDQTVVLGQAIVPIAIEHADPSTEIFVVGLPQGLIHDTFDEKISGIPERLGHYRIMVHRCDRYGSDVITKFNINVDGIVEPRAELSVTSETLLMDQQNKFHQIDDQIIYTFVVKNMGNVPLIKLRVTEPSLGNFPLPTKLSIGELASFKYIYRLSRMDFDQTSITINPIACGQTTDGIPVTTATMGHKLSWCGHDNLALKIKTIRNDDKCLLMITNNGHQEIDQLTINNQPIKETLPPNKSVFYHVTQQDGTCFKIIGHQQPDNTIIGNTYYRSKTPTQLLIKLYSTCYYVNTEQSITLVAHVRNWKKSERATVKFYDGATMIGKTPIQNQKAVLNLPSLSIGRHFIHAVCKEVGLSGSNLITEMVGDEKTLSSDDLEFIKNHVNKFKKYESKVQTILKDKTG